MTDPTPKFDCIPRLQQIAETIKERGAGTFDAPATAAYYINCAIKEIERLHRDYSCICNEMRRMMDERDEARRELREARREIRLLMHDRDAARREVCEARAACIQGKKAKEIADALGWGCFDPVDTRGLHGDPREIHVPGHFHMNSWVDDL